MVGETKLSELIAASVIILTKDEARHVERAVASAKDFREIIVVDSNSQDATAALAEAAGACVVNFRWNGDYPKKKEWSLTVARHDWVIYLDADEFLTPELVAEIRMAVLDDGNSAFEVPLRYFWLGRELKYGHRVKKRIGMRVSRTYWPQPKDLHVQNMWEVEGHYQPQLISGNCAALSHPLGHMDEDGLYDYFSRHNRYSDWEATMLHDRDTASLTSRSKQGRFAAKLPAKPIIFFFYCYIIKRGLLDGREGFHYALALSFYYWQIEIKQLELKKRDGRA